MAEDIVRHATREDIESLAEKLDAFASSLAEGERAVLARVISNAAVTTETSSAAGFSGALAIGLARGANFSGNSLPVSKVPVLDPNRLRAKDKDLFDGFKKAK